MNHPVAEFGAMATLTLPEQFGRYRILKKLGEGGMGAVYLAEDTQLRRRVALKVPHLNDENGPLAVERFLREAQAAAAIDHPNVCPVHDVGQVDGVHFLTMPFLDGTPLSRLTVRPWVPREAVELVCKLARALGVLHGKGLVHRDLKPGNIMRSPSGEPILLDFGLARSFRKDSGQLTATGQAVGTPAYMAPEQILAKPQAQGPHTDVYALGILLYQLLTGQLPFTGPLAAVYGQILHAAPQAPSQVCPGLDPALNGLCLRALAKRPQDRYGSMAEFAVALEGWLRQGEPAGPAPPRRATLTTGGAGVIRVVCPTCGKRLRLSAAAVGKHLRCPGCQTSLDSAGGPSAGTALPRTATTRVGPAPGTTLATAGPSARPGPFGRGRLLVGGAAIALMLLGGLLLTRVWKGPSGPMDAKPPRDPNENRLPTAPGLDLLVPETIALKAGGWQRFLVAVKRQNCEGPVELKLDDLPAGIRQARPALIPADANEGSVELIAEPGAVWASQAVRLRAVAAGARVEGRLLVRVEPDSTEPPRPPTLRVLVPGDITLSPGQRDTVTVRIERKRCAGPIHLSVEGLPSGVGAEPAFIGADADEGQVVLTAAPGAEAGSQTVRLRAVAAGVRTDVRLKLTVQATAPIREVVNAPPPQEEKSVPVADEAIPPPPSAQLVGTWHTTVMEQGVPAKLVCQMTADGTYVWQHTTALGTTTRVGTWRYSEGILSQTTSSGVTAKGSVRWIDNNHYAVTIIDNGVPAYTGVVCHWYRQ